MDSRLARHRGPPDPIRQELSAVRRGLLRLHKTLIDAERREFERGSGALTPGQFLQALIDDPFFAWLRPYSGLIVQIDEALADRDNPVTLASAQAFVDQVRELLGPAEEDPADPSRLHRIRRRDPDVLAAHVEVTRALSAALGGSNPA